MRRHRTEIADIIARSGLFLVAAVFLSVSSGQKHPTLSRIVGVIMFAMAVWRMFLFIQMLREK